MATPLKTFKVDMLPPPAGREANAIYLLGDIGGFDFRMFVTDDTGGGAVPAIREIKQPPPGGLDADALKVLLGQADRQPIMGGDGTYDWTPFMFGARWQTSGLTASTNRLYGCLFRPAAAKRVLEVAVGIYALGTQTTDAYQRFALYEANPVLGFRPRYWTYTRLWRSNPILHGMGHIAYSPPDIGPLDPTKFYMLVWGTTAVSSKVRYSRIMAPLEQHLFYRYGSGTSTNWRTTVYHYNNSEKPTLEGDVDFPETYANNFFINATSSNTFLYHIPMFRVGD